MDFDLEVNNVLDPNLGYDTYLENVDNDKKLPQSLDCVFGVDEIFLKEKNNSKYFEVDFRIVPSPLSVNNLYFHQKETELNRFSKITFEKKNK